MIIEFVLRCYLFRTYGNNVCTGQNYVAQVFTSGCLSVNSTYSAILDCGNYKYVVVVVVVSFVLFCSRLVDLYIFYLVAAPHGPAIYSTGDCTGGYSVIGGPLPLVHNDISCTVEKPYYQLEGCSQVKPK